MNSEAPIAFTDKRCWLSECFPGNCRVEAGWRDAPSRHEDPVALFLFDHLRLGRAELFPGIVAHCLPAKAADMPICWAKR